ncbi:hypothetical protein FB451DRAFT_1391290 [Mycena latifolia]|nr:hypothetical protein FB451DRAFT_1391290 [Mycena latifolia]
MDDASAAQAIFFQNYCHLFGVSFLIWDHIITLDVEWRYLWKHTKSTSAYWFFTIRYGALAANIPVLVFSFVTLPKKPFMRPIRSCASSAHARNTTSGLRYSFHRLKLLFLLAPVVMILRIYALYGRSAPVLWWLIGISSSFIAVALWSLHEGQHGFPVTVFSGCHLAIVQSASYHLAGPWECLFAFDSVIFLMTSYKGYVTRRSAAHGEGANMPIHRVLVRDGAMYFAAMALANLTNIVTFFIGGPLVPGSLATFATCMSVVMMARLMLNLHERADVGVLTELRMSGIDDDLEFTEGLPLTRAESNRPG